MKKRTAVDKILDILYLAGQFAPRPFESPYAWARRVQHIDPDKAYRTIYHLRRRGLVSIAKRDGQVFIRLTSKGQLQTLLNKAALRISNNWDGRWRVVMFDIPEAAIEKRRLFRQLLKQNNFLKLQASVYVSPYTLNREAIAYLKQSGLMQFIRILRVEEMDDDNDLRKHFKLVTK